MHTHESLTQKQKGLFEKLESALRKDNADDTSDVLKEASAEDLQKVLTAVNTTKKDEKRRKSTFTLLGYAIIMRNIRKIEAILKAAQENNILKDVLAIANITLMFHNGKRIFTPLGYAIDSKDSQKTAAILKAAQEDNILKDILNVKSITIVLEDNIERIVTPIEYSSMCYKNTNCSEVISRFAKLLPESKIQTSQTTGAALSNSAESSESNSSGEEYYDALEFLPDNLNDHVEGGSTNVSNQSSADGKKAQSPGREQPNNSSNVSATATQSMQKSMWPTVAISTLTVTAAFTVSAALVVYFVFQAGLVATGITAGVGACCLVTATVIYGCNRPSDVLENSSIKNVGNQMGIVEK